MPGDTITAVERALEVLALFSDRTVADLGVTEISDELDLSKAVVHRILASCRAKGFVELDERTRRYRLGPNALDLGLAYLNRVDAMREARDALRTLCDRTGETATHSVRAGWKRVYVDQVTPPRDIKMVVQIGGSYPLHAGATGKATLAFMPPELRDTYLRQARLEPLTDHTITQPEALRAEIEEIRERGYATSLGERQEGAGSVAAPVLDHTGWGVATLSVCGPVERFRSEVASCAEAIIEVTGDVSRRLGFRGGAGA